MFTMQYKKYFFKNKLNNTNYTINLKKNKKNRKKFQTDLDTVFSADCTQVLLTMYHHDINITKSKKNIDRRKNKII